MAKNTSSPGAKSEPTKSSSKSSGKSAGITTSSTAEYFSKNLQQVGFSSLPKAVLTTVKEAIDNSLDACEEAGILPEITLKIEKLGAGSLKNSEKIKISIDDNGPGIDSEDLAKVFGEYLASSKFGKGRCSRGQQGIGISAATTWGQLTNATGARVTSKTKAMRKAVTCLIEVDIKHNKGVIRERETLDWDKPHGTHVEFIIDGRLVLNGEGGLLTYINGTTLVNPHMTFHYQLPEAEKITVERVSTIIPEIPEPVEPHPHTMKLGEFIAHSHLFGRVKVGAWLKKGFSRVHEGTLKELTDAGIKKAVLEKSVDALADTDFKDLYAGLQNLKLMAPSTKSVLAIGEEALSKSILRMGEIDFFSVVSRKPAICDFKPVQIEVAVARLLDRSIEMDSPVQVLRFANRVPLQFDKAGCAMFQAVQTVNWRSYGLAQPKDSLPQGPYIVALSVVSPFIKFKNASKETVDASDELVEEIRRALIQAGQKLSRHIRKESKAAELEEKIRYIEQFGPILVEGLARITKSSDAVKKKAEEGLRKILGRDATDAEKELEMAEEKLVALNEAQASKAAKAKGKDGNDDGSEGGEAPAGKTSKKTPAAGKATGKSQRNSKTKTAEQESTV